ncbi:intracellular coagulation inhibitor 1-like isoform X1 [Ornithodoros turicata]|uniref:intracellular coagulation inhibitor 1-like isoform X1 n=1 Tax=Ornithodoros turicata TaxID=34597 RepID=UPI003139850A
MLPIIFLVCTTVIKASLHVEAQPLQKTKAKQQPLSTATNKFGVDLLKRLPVNQEHVFFSPYSLSVALAMLYHGARGVSEKELSRVLGYEAAGLTRKDVLKGTELLLQELDRHDENITLEVANAVLVPPKFPVVHAYAEDIENIFEAFFKIVDFGTDTERALAELNGWAKNKTRGKISSLVDALSEDTVMALLNAVYFKAAWKNGFDDKSTLKLPFYNYGKSPTQVSTMLRRGTYPHAFAWQLKADVLELPYAGDGFSMFILLPRGRKGLIKTLKKVTAPKLIAATKKVKNTTVELRLPKFKLSTKYQLKEGLSKLGARSIFDQRDANFTGIVAFDYLYVSGVYHKATFGVNEKGSEAAAATAVVIDVKSAATKSFKVDHPFLFWIADKREDTILFLGVVNALSESSESTEAPKNAGEAENDWNGAWNTDERHEEGDVVTDLTRGDGRRISS